MTSEPKIGAYRYSVITWQTHTGEWAWMIKLAERVRFKSSKRVGWRGRGFAPDGGGAPTRLEAQRAGRAAVQKIKERWLPAGQRPARTNDEFYVRREVLRREALERDA
jgi:hypothetical protein